MKLKNIYSNECTCCVFSPTGEVIYAKKIMEDKIWLGSNYYFSHISKTIKEMYHCYSLKNVKMKKAILFLVTIMSIISCKKDNPAPASPGVIKIGSVLAYKINMYDNTGTIQLTYDYSITISGEKVIGGETWLVTVAEIAGLGTDTGYVRKTSTGYQIFENNTAQLYLKMPAAVNDTWAVTNSLSNVHNYTVKGLDQTVTVPKGAISCFYAETLDQSGYLNKVWYNDAYMIVKLDAFDEPTPGTLVLQSTLELVSFTP